MKLKAAGAGTFTNPLEPLNATALFASAGTSAVWLSVVPALE